MNRSTLARPALTTALTAVATLAMLAALPGCGGGSEAGVAGSAGVARAWAPLLDDEGGTMPTDPSALPADPAARALAARHASAEQAAALDAALPGGVLPVEVDAPGSEDQAIAIAQAVQASLDLRGDAPVLVRGADARAVARTADQLVALGHSRVWAVTP
jgi:hypothetical protein